MSRVVQGVDHGARSIRWAERALCGSLRTVPYTEIAALLFDQDADHLPVEVHTNGAGKSQGLIIWEQGGSEGIPGQHKERG